MDRDTSWIDRYSLDAWNAVELAQIERNMSQGHPILITDTRVGEDWEFTMDWARLIRDGTQPVTVQGKFVPLDCYDLTVLSAM